jgi:hypothetical protein
MGGEALLQPPWGNLDKLMAYYVKSPSRLLERQNLPPNTRFEYLLYLFEGSWAITVTTFLAEIRGTIFHCAPDNRSVRTTGTLSAFTLLLFNS